MHDSLEDLIRSLREHPNVIEKLKIESAYAPSLPVSHSVAVGDDTAVIPDGDGHLLFAAEGMMEAFIERDPWFAGYCAVMVNLSDIAAMGGRPTAIVDVLWAHPDSAMAKEIWAGMRAASEAYGVPIVGGHTTRFPVERTPLLAAAVVGKAKKIISSFTAEPGHALLMAVNMNAAYRGEGTLFWNGSVGTAPEVLRSQLSILAELAEEGLAIAGKDISNGGIPGTLAMLCATSRVGATVDLEALPPAPHDDLKRWLLAFPSYGYLLTTSLDKVAAVEEKFARHQIECRQIGTITECNEIKFRQQGVEATFCEVSFAPASASSL